MLLSQFLNIIPIVALLQLAVWVWYIDKQALINRLMAIICLLLVVENTMIYCYDSMFYVEYQSIFNAFDISIWSLLSILIIYYLILFVEHPVLSNKWWMVSVFLLNLPLVLSPIVTLPIAYGHLKNWAAYMSFDSTSGLMFYYSVVSFAVIGMMVYILTYARFSTNNYRIQKQATLIIKAFVFVISAFLPQLIIWVLGYDTPTYLRMYPEVVFFGVIIYAMTKYRAQSLSTSFLVTEMIEHALELSMVVLPNGEIISVNNRVEKFLGYKKQEIEKIMFFNLVEDKTVLLSELKRVEVEQNYTPYIDLNIRLHNGSYLAVKVGITPIRNKFREILGFYFVFYAPVEEVKLLEDLQTRFGLSSREKDVAMLLVKGMSNQDIADQLFISLATVKSHSNNIYRKTSSTNKLELKKMVV